MGSEMCIRDRLWTDFSSSPATGILDGYTILAGVTTVAALTHHGALWIAIKTEGALLERARRAAHVAGWAALGLTALLTVWTRDVQPRMRLQFADHPWGYLFPVIAAAGLAAAIVFRRKGRDLSAFLGSTAYLAGMMSSVAFSIFPYVLPSSIDPSRGLTVQQAAAHESSLRIALAWWVPGIALAAASFVYVYRKFAGKTTSGDGHY